MFDASRWRKIRLIAHELGATDHQVKKWYEKRAIPGLWHLRLLAACQAQRVRLTAAELLEQQQRNGGKDG